MNLASSEIRTCLPGFILSLLLIAATVLIWIMASGMLFPLDWRIGNIQSIAYLLLALFGLLTVISILNQRLINVYFCKLFPRRKEFIFALICFSTSLFLSLLTAEFILRLLDLLYKPYWSYPFYSRATFDPELGWAYIPNQSFFQRFIKDGPKVPVYSDQFGARVKTPDKQHDPSAPTVIFIGGSFTMGYGIPYEETFVGQYEALSNFQYSVVNLGVEGYGTAQSLLLLKRYLDKFNTKVVVYTFIPDHIERNANYDPRLRFRGSRFHGTRPLFSLTRDGKLYLKKRPIKVNDINETRIWAMIKFFWTRWGPIPTLDLTISLIQEMKNLVESNGAVFVFIYWNWGSSKAEKILDYLKEMKINVINTGVNSPSGWRSQWYLPNDSHPNALAHAHVAQLIAEKLYVPDQASE